MVRIGAHIQVGEQFNLVVPPVKDTVELADKGDRVVVLFHRRHNRVELQRIPKGVLTNGWVVGFENVK